MTTTKAERLLLSRLSSAGTILLSVHLALPEVPAWCDGTFGEICAFYEVDRPPGVFRYLARDPAFLQG